MRFQCALHDCKTTTSQPYTVEAVNLEEGRRRMADHWATDHDLPGFMHAEVHDVVMRMLPGKLVPPKREPWQGPGLYRDGDDPYGPGSVR